MEAVASLAGEEHTDHPTCTCPVLATYGRLLNDIMGYGEEGDALRTKYLAPLILSLITRSSAEVEVKRAFYFTNHAVQFFTPLVLEAEGFADEAEQLRNIHIVDSNTDIAWATVRATMRIAYTSNKHSLASRCAAVAAEAIENAATAPTASAMATVITIADAIDAAQGRTDPVWQQAAQVLADACQIC